MLFVAQVVGFSGVLIAEIGVSIANVSSTAEVASPEYK